MTENLYERYCRIRDNAHYKDADVARITGITKSTFSDWKTGRYTPKQEKLQKIANCFGVTVGYLMTGQEIQEKKESELTTRDKRDISKDLDRIMDEIENDDDSPLFYKNGPISDRHKELLRNAIELALEDAKQKNKVLYNPHKNKPKN